MNAKRYQHFALVGIIVVAVAITMATVQFKVPTILTSIMALFDLTASGGSWLMSSFTVAAIIFGFVFGTLAQRFSPKRILIIATGILVVGSVIGAFTGVGWVLILSRALEGIAITAAVTCGPIIIQRCVRPEKVSSAYGIWGIWSSGGSVFAGLVTPTLFNLYGFTALWLMFAGLVVVATTTMAVLLREPKEEKSDSSLVTLDSIQGLEGDLQVACVCPTMSLSPDGEKGTEQQGRDDASAHQIPDVTTKPRYRELLTKNIIFFFIGLTSFNLCILAAITFLPTILQMRGVEATMSGFISTLPMLISIVACPLIGIIADRIGSPKGLLVFGMSFFGPCVYLMYTQTGALMWTGAALMGIMALGSGGMIMSLFTRIMPRLELAPIAIGLSVTIQGVGQFLGTFVVQLLLGPEFLNVTLAGVVIMLFGLIGAASFGFCRMLR